MNPTNETNNVQEFTNFSTLGRTHSMINDPRTRVLTEICRRLEVAKISYSHVNFGSMTTEYLVDFGKFISQTNDDIQFRMTSIEGVNAVTKYQMHLIEQILNMNN